MLWGARGAWGRASTVCIWKEIPAHQCSASALLDVKIKTVKEKKKIFFQIKKLQKNVLGRE